jgi:hypothetical protein
MKLKQVVGLAVTTLTLNLSILSDVNAASVEVKCEARGASRSKVSVDGRGFGAGLYRALSQSGTGAKWSKVLLRPVAGEVEFDFDSNPTDVRAGATAIVPTFIKNGVVKGKIYSYNSLTRIYTLRASVTEGCRVR